LSKQAPKFSISREAISAVYRAGEGAVIALVEGLVQQHIELEARIKSLEVSKRRLAITAVSHRQAMVSANAQRVYGKRVSAPAVVSQVIQVARWSGARKSMMW